MSGHYLVESCKNDEPMCIYIYIYINIRNKKRIQNCVSRGLPSIVMQRVELV